VTLIRFRLKAVTISDFVRLADHLAIACGILDNHAGGDFGGRSEANPLIAGAGFPNVQSQ
jgi:hypothetical protein